MVDENERARVQGLAVAAALTVLSASVGVDLHNVMAAELPEQLGSNQSKISPPTLQGSQQSKFDSMQQKLDRTQQKFPSKQSKDPVMPGVKPIDPPR
jgi:hypothetical protein